MVAKKIAVKKAPKKTTKKVAHKSAATKRAAQMKSFHLYKDDRPFTSTQVTRQTVYWTILLIVIMVLQLWILKVLLDIADMTATLNG
jgi:hypothetical protein